MRKIGWMTVTGDRWSNNQGHFPPGMVGPDLYVVERSDGITGSWEKGYMLAGYIVRGDLEQGCGEVYKTRQEAGTNWLPVYHRREEPAKPEQPTIEQRLEALEKSVELLAKAVRNDKELEHLPKTDNITFADLAFLAAYVALRVKPSDLPNEVERLIAGRPKPY